MEATPYTNHLVVDIESFCEEYGYECKKLDKDKTDRRSRWVILIRGENPILIPCLDSYEFMEAFERI